MVDGALISIVDDDESIRKATKRLIESVGAQVEDFASAEEFLSFGRPDTSACLILDVRLPGISGLELQSQLRASGSEVPIVFVTAHGDAAVRARALEGGAVDFLQKPFSENALFKAIDFFAAKSPAEETETETRTSTGHSEKFSFEHIIGRSPVMLEMLRLARKVAESQVSSVLLQGESGTGKDLVAKAIHNASKRADHPFIAINCAALPSNLIESELFGYEKGAFTDAKTRKAGLFEQANGGGTIFLDEISELDINLQAKLLRVLEDGSFRRVGGLKDVPFNARVIAASNRDLKSESEMRRFRLDLYYRLAVIQLDIPPLCERGEDVMLLAEHFVALGSRNGGPQISGFSPEAIRAFRHYNWPGNVRELRNVIERTMILEDGDIISTRYLPRDIAPEGDNESPHRVMVVDADATVSLPPRGISLDEVETSLLKQALAQAKGNQTRAADLLGLSRDQFRYRLKKIRGEESAANGRSRRQAAVH
ncbi:MAG TPA: sigma-54 dependent transcriptional regulator [Pyrinomonadaceae bacterium]|jgi:DNA-binding NtrC family response regulator|nr:sigma-54 dependent transcriptional regulator [Pyrinomonadaceae bacterium]